MAVEQENWLDNFQFQEFLTLETYKAVVSVSADRVSTVENNYTSWPLFFHADLTWKDLISAVAAEAQLVQVWCEFIHEN